MKESITGKIGCEVEFWTDYHLEDDFLESNNIIREYYSKMYELNNFLQNWETEKDIHNFFTDVVKHTNKIKKLIEEEDSNKVTINTRGVSIDSNSLAFNGLHIHVSLDNFRQQLNLFNRLQNSGVISNWKMNTYPSLRSVLSHHIWGGIRSYSYSYKSRRKFVPVLWTDINTIELRIFDNEDIFITSRRKKLAKFLFKVFTNKPVINEDPNLNIESGENLKEICSYMETFNRKNYHSVVRNGYMVTIKNKCNTIVMDLSENYLQVRR